MLATKEQKEICKEYSQLDKSGQNKCNVCPLIISVGLGMCHNNSHFDSVKCEFVKDNFKDNETN